MTSCDLNIPILILIVIGNVLLIAVGLLVNRWHKEIEK